MYLLNQSCDVVFDSEFVAVSNYVKQLIDKTVCHCLLKVSNELESLNIFSVFLCH